MIGVASLIPDSSQTSNSTISTQTSRPDAARSEPHSSGSGISLLSLSVSVWASEAKVKQVKLPHMASLGLQWMFGLSGFQFGGIFVSSHQEIRVHLVHKPNRRYIYMRWRDPLTGEEHTRSTKTAVERQALRAANIWEDELKAGQVRPEARITWVEFRTRFENEHLAALRESTDLKVSVCLSAVEDILKPTYLDQITTERISHFLTQLRQPHEVQRSGGRVERVTRSERTVAGYRRSLGMALRWASGLDLIRLAPKMPPVMRAARGQKLMKGRPVTDAEFTAMLNAVPEIVGSDRAAEWVYFLRGLWLSGLRLAESLELYWDRDDKLSIDLTGKYPMLRIPAALEKAGVSRLLPMTPDFARHLAEVPRDGRTGPVFTFTKLRANGGDRPTDTWVSHMVTKIGKQAGITVDDTTGKFASAHDLRRSFGDRWSRRVQPKVLMELMRHEDISTTLRYYVRSDSEATAATLWGDFIPGDTLGDTSDDKQKTPTRDRSSIG